MKRKLIVACVATLGANHVSNRRHCPAGEGFDVGFTAEDRRRQCDRHTVVEIAPVPLEPVMWREPDPEVQVARLGAGGAVLAFAGHANT